MHDLPNSNQSQEVGISHVVKADAQRAVIDRRAIPLAAVESQWSAADGHAIRRIDWPGAGTAPRGSILFFPGRGDAYEKYLESLNQWHEAGWRVTAADWRGQAGSGRLGDDPVTGHVSDFSIWIDDLAHIWAQWVASTPGPHILMGHSMGGHLVLRGVADKAVAPDGLVLSAPMLGFAGNALPLNVMHSAARILARLRGNTTPAWKWSEKPGQIPAGRIDLLTHDQDRYGDELFWRDTRPELVMGPGSWGWVERAYASMRGLFAPGVLEAIQIPVLLLGAEHDKLVDIKAIREATRRLPHSELIAFGVESHHEILREVDAVRDRAMDAVASFLDRVAAKQ